jgi:putative lipoic acid-binding regulatory protein
LKLPPIELLESTHQFPGPYIFKIITNTDEGTLKNILSVLQTALKLPSLPVYTSRLSESGKHTSLTVELELQKAQEVHLVYEALYKTPGVLLLL